MPCFYAAFSQNSGPKITGHVKDANNNAITDVTVYLLKAVDSSLVKFSAPDKNGVFEFSGLTAGNYLIAVTGIGYKKMVAGPYLVKGNTNISASDMRLTTDVTALKQVDIVAEKQFIEIKPGKKILNVQYSPIAIGSNALEILKQAAGVKVDNNNTISLNGKNGVQVLIDGRSAYMQQDAVIDMLQGLQSNVIDQIELISNAGANYDAAAGGVINIKLKKNENYGTNGSITASAGAHQLTDNYGSRFRGGSGLTFNNRTKNLNVFGNYSYSYIPYNRVFVTDRFVNYNNNITELNGDYFSDQSRSVNNYRLGADYYFAPKQIIGFFVTGVTNNFVLNKTTQTGISHLGKTDSTIATASRLDSKAAQVAVDLNYKGTLFKTSELSVDLDYFSYNRTPLENITSNYFNSATNTLYRTLNIQNSFPSNYKIYTYNINYDIKLSPTSSLTAIEKMVNVTAHNNLDFGEMVGNVYHPDPKFTNHFDYTETINYGAIIYNKTFGKKLTMEAGLRLEQTISDGTSSTSTTAGDNDYTDIFPDINFTGTVNKDNLLHLSYAKHIYRPIYTDLNPFIAYQDQYSYYMGNPYLKPVYLSSVELEHIYKGNYSTTLVFSVYNNVIQSIFTQNDTTQIIINRKANLGNRYLYSIKFDGKFKPAPWWTANITLLLSYNRFTSTPSQSYLNTGGRDIDLKVDQFYNLHNDYKLELFGEYETPITYGIFQYRSFYQVNTGISKTVNKQFNVALNIHDIFNTNLSRIQSTYQNLNLTGRDKVDFRYFLFTVSYKFGSKTIKNARERHTGAEDEQIRATPPELKTPPPGS